MLAGALGGSSLLAGCLGDDGEPDDDDTGQDDGDDDSDDGDDDGDVPADLHVEGQSLIIPTPNNPDSIDFAGQVGNQVDTGTEHRDDLYAATMEPGFWGRWFSTTYYESPPDEPGVYAGLYSDWEIEADTITLTIHEEAGWSDGEPVRAKDAVGHHALQKQAPVWDPAPGESRLHIGAVGDYSMPDGPDGKVIEWHIADDPGWDDFGGFLGFSPGEVYRRLGSNASTHDMRLGPAYPSHREPFKPFVDRAIEIWDEKPDDADGHVMDLVAEDIEIDEEAVLATREPENIVTSGAWTVGDIRGAQEVILVPNEHSPHADDINFDELVFEYTAESHRARAGLQSEHLDFASVTVPEAEMDTIPDQYEVVPTPTFRGYVLGMDFNSFFGDVRVRQAIMFALDTEAIAGNIHPTLTQGVQMPGLDHWGAESIIDEDWAAENLIDYSQDLDRAEALMQEAGFERQDGTWQKDGEPFSVELATMRDEPRMETTVVSQLQQFGIDIGFRVYDQDDFAERWRANNEAVYIEEEYGGSGDFTFWANDLAGRQMAGFFNTMWHFWWISINSGRKIRRFNFQEHDLQESTMEQYASNGYVRGNYSLWHDWTVDLPPFGEPDGEKEPFGPSYVWGDIWQGPSDFNSPFGDYPFHNPPHDEPHEENREYTFKMYAWLANYWLPVMPVALNSNQNFYNDANWDWPSDHDMWEYFGQRWGTPHLCSMNRILADPDNPKSGANVVEN